MSLKKLIAGFLVAAFLFGVSAASCCADVTTFGYEQRRQRRATDDVYPPLELKWWSGVGKSYSQPIILGPETTGKDHATIYMLARNCLYQLDDTQTGGKELSATWRALQLDESKTYSDSYIAEPGASHPTFIVTQAGRPLLFQGTKDGWLTCYQLDGKQAFAPLKIGSRITSAPLVTYWEKFGRKFLLVTVGSDDGNAYVVANWETGAPIRVPLPVGGVLTSSPAPIGEDGFVIGSDGATGKVVAYYYASALDVSGNALKGRTGYKPAWTFHTPAGVPASFSVESGYVYFSDKRGHLYKLDALSGRKIWENRDFVSASTFINRSPALDANYVYFPIVNNKGTGKGAVAVLSKSTGKLVKTLPLSSRAVTAPVVWEKANLIAVGEEAGMMTLFRRGGDWSVYKSFQIVSPPGTPADQAKAEGVTTEISVSDGILVVGGSDKNLPVGGKVMCWGVADKPPADLNKPVAPSPTQGAIDLRIGMVAPLTVDPMTDFTVKLKVPNFLGKSPVTAKVKFVNDYRVSRWVDTSHYDDTGRWVEDGYWVVEPKQDVKYLTITAPAGGEGVATITTPSGLDVNNHQYSLTLTATVNYDHSVPESNYSNNTVTQNVPVTWKDVDWKPILTR